MREAGKTYANAVGEVREAADFLRYYAAEAVRLLGPGSPAPLGVVACISPWNFPLAIFTGQVAAALAAGNAVVAKPAEETPLIAAEAVRVLHEAGVPPEALALLPGAGEVGAAIVADPRVQGVVFTGSTPVARLIERAARRPADREGAPVPLIAETGGLNAMVVDSSALPEQVVADVISSAFDSAGQRCSALRILCLQDDVADRMLAMLKGAMAELEVGDPRKLSVDVGPVITAEARDAHQRPYRGHVGRGFAVTQAELPEAAACGTFVAPTLIEIDKVADVEREVFGPVLHVLRYRRERARRADRCDQRRRLRPHLRPAHAHRRDDRARRRADRGRQHLRQPQHHRRDRRRAAVRRLAPFGHRPEGGRPALSRAPRRRAAAGGAGGARRGRRPRSARCAPISTGCARRDMPTEAERCVGLASRSPLGARVELAGPVGERNVYALRRRGRIAALATNRSAALIQIGAILATGNDAIVSPGEDLALKGLPPELAHRVTMALAPLDAPALAGVLFEGEAEALADAMRRLAARPGPIVRIQALTPERLAAGEDFDLAALVEEVAIATNTAAAGGNASLMAVG